MVGINFNRFGKSRKPLFRKDFGRSEHLGDAPEVRCIYALAQACDRKILPGVNDEAAPPRDFFRAGDLHPLPPFKGRD
jgi:hypothetical protein